MLRRFLATLATPTAATVLASANDSGLLFETIMRRRCAYKFCIVALLPAALACNCSLSRKAVSPWILCNIPYDPCGSWYAHIEFSRCVPCRPTVTFRCFRFARIREQSARRASAKYFLKPLKVMDQYPHVSCQWLRRLASSVLAVARRLVFLNIIGDLLHGQRVQLLALRASVWIDGEVCRLEQQ